MNEKQCRNCSYYEVNKPCISGEAATEGECRKNAPIPSLTIPSLTMAGFAHATQAVFPVVEESQWCGEFKFLP